MGSLRGARRRSDDPLDPRHHPDLSRALITTVLETVVMEEDQVSWPEGLRASAPLGLPTAVVGASFGLVAAQVLGAWPAVMMSALVWSGTAQFAVLSVLTGGGAPVLAGSTALLSNARFLPMGFAIAPSMTSRPLRRFLIGALLADASFAIAHRAGGRFDPAAIAWAAPVQYGAWVGGTLVGVAGADAVGDPDRWGLDVLFPVYYLSLLLPELFPGGGDKPRRSAKDLNPKQQHRAAGRHVASHAVVAAVAAGVIALVLTPVTPAGVPILAAAAAALIGLLPTRGAPGKRIRDGVA